VERFSAQPELQVSRLHAMAHQTQRANVVEIALSTPFGYGEDMVGIPK
jgi:hypothetical protein